VVRRVIFILLFLSWPAGSLAQSRHALVIGIDNYVSVPSLEKARNDARSVHDVLSQAGFRSDLLLDPDQLGLLTAVNSLSGRVSPGDEVVFYFAGHGVEIDGRNYLLPKDVPQALPGGEFLVTSRALPLDSVLDLLRVRGARVSLLIVDACRDNPFPRQGTRSLGGSRGLGRVDSPPEGTFILFSAGNGQTALDRLSDNDPDPNSVFTRILLPRLSEPGVPIHELSRDVRTAVRQLARTVGHDQFPAVYDQFDGNFSVVAALPTALVAQPAAPATGSDPCLAILPLWTIMEQSNDTEALLSFAETYGSSCQALAVLARNRAGALSATRTETVPPSTAPAPVQLAPNVPPGHIAPENPGEADGLIAEVPDEAFDLSETSARNGAATLLALPASIFTPSDADSWPVSFPAPLPPSEALAGLPSSGLAGQPAQTPQAPLTVLPVSRSQGEDVRVTQAELNHIRFVLAQSARRSVRIEPRSPTVSDILDSDERDALERFNIVERGIGAPHDVGELRLLTREAADALLSRRLAPGRALEPDRVDVIQHRDWSSYYLYSRCEISTVAQSVSPPTTATLPELRISMERGFGSRNGRQQLVLWDIVRPDQFGHRQAITAFIDGRRHLLFRTGWGSTTRVHVAMATRELEENFLRQMRNGQVIEVRGVDVINEEQVLIRYSLIGFTSALRRAAEICNRPDVL
jgi:hypothetical protein